MSAFGIRKKEMFLRLHSSASDESYIQTNDYDSRLVHELDLPGPGLVAHLDSTRSKKIFI